MNTITDEFDIDNNIENSPVYHDNLEYPVIKKSTTSNNDESNKFQWILNYECTGLLTVTAFLKTLVDDIYQLPGYWQYR